ncbi:hypothetical protein P9213_01370 [Geobacillus stearothermophilus]|uniref:hypothetical protein n=1 Tax=Geobacillus stearothermophilus TaxID=1422 RepID=UPI002E20DE97|nr:hypothetical protein [Geobacillus stearothermophilus]MED4355388.1 hypothetical protein [Geobacillus stearothermophilus]
MLLKKTSIDNFLDLWKYDKYLHFVDPKNYELLSLDIFDTIIFRTCHHPTDVFLEVGNRAKKRGLLRKGLTPKEFQQIRIVAKDKARRYLKKRYGHDEVTLKNIYDQFPKNISNQNELMKIELEVEQDYCYLNPSIVSIILEFIKYGKPVVLVSDMYLSSQQIIDILAKNKFPIDYIDRIFVSNEHSGGKSSGILFEVLLKYYNDIKSSKILHIGDNKKADVLAAAKYGITTIHYKVVPSSFDSVFEWERIRYGEVILPEILSLRKLAGSLSANYDKSEEFWFKLGAEVLGPFFALFADWVIHISMEEHKNGIYPFMREGKILKELLKRSADYHGTSIDIKELYVSRQATYLPSLEKLDKESIEKLFDRRNLKVKDVFKMFDLLECSQVFADYYNLDVSETRDVLLPSGINLRTELINYLLSEEVQKRINIMLEEKRNLFIQYLQQEVKSLENVITVDLGFQGTIQKSIEKALKLSEKRYSITHLLALGAETNKFNLLEGMDIRGFVGNAGENIEFIKTIMRSPEGLEQLIMKRDGSTLDYKYDYKDNKVVPILDENRLKSSEIRAKEICQQGMFIFQKLWFYFKDNKEKTAQMVFSKKTDICKLVHRLIDLPSYQEAMKIGDLSHDDNFGTTSINKICTSENEKLVSDMGIPSFLNRCLYSYQNGKVYWPQAVVTRKNPSYLFKKYVKLNDTFSYLAIMSQMVSKVIDEGNKKVIVYGAGEAGHALMQAAHLFSLEVECIVDRNKSIWGQKISGVEIVSLDEAIERGLHVYLIASFAFAHEIKKDIEDRYSIETQQPKIYLPF